MLLSKKKIGDCDSTLLPAFCELVYAKTFPLSGSLPHSPDGEAKSRLSGPESLALDRRYAHLRDLALASNSLGDAKNLCSNWNTQPPLRRMHCER